MEPPSAMDNDDVSQVELDSWKKLADGTLSSNDFRLQHLRLIPTPTHPQKLAGEF